MNPEDPQTDMDNPWKEALERHLYPFLSLCFPAVEARIDWHQPVEFHRKVGVMRMR